MTEVERLKSMLTPHADRADAELEMTIDRELHGSSFLWMPDGRSGPFYVIPPEWVSRRTAVEGGEPCYRVEPPPGGVRASLASSAVVRSLREPPC